MQCLLHLATETDDNSRSSILDGHSGAGFLRHGIIPEFDDYELLEEIAHGGMGVVYRARQVSLNRTVAVKLILAGQLATPDSIERFQLEARAAAHLDHPGIVPVYKVGEYQGQHFISMKLIDGDNLDRQLRRHSLDRSMSPAELRSRQTAIAGLVSRIARAVQYAHDHGVLHRDIKPHNILIDREGNPHLTDFGLAKLTGHDQAGLTLTDAVLGSPSYMAPEQAAGDFAEITVQTDVYGVGALLYELLAGRPPFLGRSVLETMRNLADQPPRNPRSFIPGVHPDLETIALKCLEKKPIHRYLSAGLLADELDRFCNGQPIKARPVSIAVSMSRWCLRHKLVASLSATILIAFLTGFVAVTW
ncbi:MAG: serine/threonine protein kinase, partial [Planctomycetaceae bacterium]|nr:serine/threonine protein kinase [Planctomycetaceae bacterium]